MKRRFKSINTNKILKKIYVLLIILSFSFTLYLSIYNKDVKNYLVSSLISETTKKESALEKEIKSILTNPKNIVYSSLNKVVSKKSLAVFNNVSSDNFDYSKAISDYAIDTKEEDNDEEPLVYIYNTHQLEEYESDNILHSVKPNVMIASYIFKEKLKNYNIPSKVETNNMKEYLNKYGLSYNDSYEASQFFAKEIKKQYPSIKYMFDLHRDSLTKDLTSITIDNKPYTKVLFVVGYEHTIDENNIGFAEKLEEMVSTKYEGLSRGVIYRVEKGEYGVYDNNIDATSLLLEIGGVDSTLEEVNNTVEVISEIFNEYLGDR